jgi:hypothetical protein
MKTDPPHTDYRLMVSTRLPISVVERAKQYALAAKVSMQDLVEDALVTYLSERGWDVQRPTPPIAAGPDTPTNAELLTRVADVLVGLTSRIDSLEQQQAPPAPAPAPATRRR